jgi:hypothetical protein
VDSGCHGQSGEYSSLLSDSTTNLTDVSPVDSYLGVIHQWLRRLSWLTLTRLVKDLSPTSW